jgi:hypothetical protein
MRAKCEFNIFDRVSSCTASWRWAVNSRNMPRVWSLIKCKWMWSLYQVDCIYYVHKFHYKGVTVGFRITCFVKLESDPRGANCIIIILYLSLQIEWVMHLPWRKLPHPLTVAIWPSNVPEIAGARLTIWMLSEITKTYVLMQNVKDIFLCIAHFHQQNATLTL